MKKLKVSVIGLGFVGLTLAVVNAKKGFKTIGIDIDKKKISSVRNGNADFYEPNLESYLKESIKKNNIKFSNDFNEIIDTDLTFVTVGTPSTKNGKIDLSYIKKSISSIVSVLKEKKQKHTIVIKSTVVPTTTLKEILPKIKKLKNVNLVVNPEFLREGLAINDLLKPHIIVIGENKKGEGTELKKYYNEFYKNKVQILFTDYSSAEMIKYSNNAFLATKISFINSIANICQSIPNADVKTIAYAIGKDPRIGPLFLNSGPGFGGSCLPKDLAALIHFSKKINESNMLLKSVKDVNDNQPKKIIKIIRNMGIFNDGKTISILGLAFKKNTDDIRASRTIPLINLLLKNGLNVKVHDPMAINNFKKIFQSRIEYCKTIKDCLMQSDCCVIMTGWDEYGHLNPNSFKNNMNSVNIIDAQRILNSDKFKDVSFKAIGLGT